MAIKICYIALVVLYFCCIAVWVKRDYFAYKLVGAEPGLVEKRA